jgi:hypothetical protein
MHEPARQRTRDLANPPAFANAQRERKKVEAMFAELKNLIGLRRLRSRRMNLVRDQFLRGSSGPERQATGALPRPTDSTHWGIHHLTEVNEEGGDTSQS